ncbi:MAG TPA: NifB/NifX family molybdenum-iron cluster-binding protein [Spirochaetia bacterium]|nr:NifB/NifX family molybdenum-iron cluster-binding protein [Spirochaetia bacterium]
MRIAIPVAEGKLSMHFGHCERFALIDVDPEAKTILKKQEIEAPEHQPGLFPRWLAQQGAQLVIAGGMGPSAQNLFVQNGIRVLTGASAQAPETLAMEYMAGTLVTGNNVCDH